MKIADRGGHNPQSQGANGIVNEIIEDRKILASTNKWLKIDNQEVTDVTPGNCVSAEDLKYGVDQAKLHKADIFASIHLNAGGGKGAEVLYSLASTQGKELATRVSNSIAKLGFVNRGAKIDSRGLYELRRTPMPAIIIECFFCDSKIDVELYNKVGADKLGKAIAEGIVGHEIKEPVIEPKINYVLETQKFLNKLGITDYDNKKLIEDGFTGTRTRTALNKLVLKL